MRRSPLLLVVLGLALLPGRSSADGDFGPIEEGIVAGKAKMAKVWLDLAEDLAKKDLKTEALDAVAQARLLTPDSPDVAAGQKKADALAGKGTLDDAAKKAVAKARRDVAKGFDALAALLDKERQDARYTAFLVAALGTEPTKDRLRVLAEMAKKDPLLLQAPGHPLSALVSLPKTWKPGKEYPLLVTLEGEQIVFDANLNHFRDERGAREWIVVCPHTLTSAVEVKFDRYPAYPEALVREWNFKRLEFDDAGLLPLLDFLHTHFGAASKFALAGHSTGATMALRTLLMHPERVARAVFTGPKADPEAPSGAGTAKEGGPPVLILLGSRDTARVAEADAVTSAMKEHGVTQVERRAVPGVLRSDFPKEVWEFVDQVTTR